MVGCLVETGIWIKMGKRCSRQLVVGRRSNILYGTGSSSPLATVVAPFVHSETMKAPSCVRQSLCITLLREGLGLRPEEGGREGRRKKEGLMEERR